MAAPRSETFVVRELRQAKLLADPLRLRLLHGFADEPRSIKAVAQLLDEPISRLYRHVHALHDAGLLRIAARRRVRGTVEKRYLSVARRFELDQSLFTSKSSAGVVRSRRSSIAARLLDETRQEIARHEAASSAGDPAAVVMRAQLRVPSGGIQRIQAALEKLFESTASPSRRGADRESWSATVVLYPDRRGRG